MEFGIREIIKAGGPVFIILLIISIYSISVIIEKYVEFKNIIFKNSILITKLIQAIKNDKVKDVIKNAYLQKGYINEIITSLVNHPGTLREKREYISSVIEYHTTLLTKKLNSLATIGSTAPYIGLLGTVIGVIRAFKDMAEFQSAGPHIIAHGISEALVNTAMGLFVAIPAVIAYNYFVSRINRYTQELNYLLEQIIDRYYRNEDT